jgi:hypothetical protein
MSGRRVWRRHEGFENRVKEVEKSAAARVATVEDELCKRRDKQYEMLQRLTRAEAIAHKAHDQVTPRAPLSAPLR